MICENCKQRPATVTVTQVQNGQKSERHYCDVCATHFHPFHVNMEQEPLSLHQFLTNWFGTPNLSHATSSQHGQNQPGPKACPKCGFTFRHFLNEGKFGCANCYETFRSELPKVLKRFHNGNVKHVGKAPSSMNELYELKKQIDEARLQMKAAIEEENFEHAALLRDEIREIERQLHVGGEKDDEH